MKTRTFAMIKPDAVAAHQTGNILCFIEGEKPPQIIIVEMAMLSLSGGLAAAFYSAHEGKPFYEKLIEFTISGPLVGLVLEGENVVEEWRKLIGATNPEEAAFNTIRHCIGKGMPNNAVHGSDSLEAAEVEIQQFHCWLSWLSSTLG